MKQQLFLFILLATLVFACSEPEPRCTTCFCDTCEEYDNPDSDHWSAVYEGCEDEYGTTELDQRINFLESHGFTCDKNNY